MSGTGSLGNIETHEMHKISLKDERNAEERKRETGKVKKKL